MSPDTSHVKMTQFPGMDNVSKEANPVRPRVILNMDAVDAGYLKKREGYSQVIVKQDTHSIFALDDTFCVYVATGSIPQVLWLYNTKQNTSIELGSVTGPVEKLAYTKYNNAVYISNSYWSGLLTLQNGVWTLSSWIIPAPSIGPSAITNTFGSLPIGTYGLVYTTITPTGFVSPRSVMTYITLTAIGGISLLNTQSNLLVWIVPPGDDKLYLVSQEGGVNAINNLSSAQFISTKVQIAAPLMSVHTLYYGRIYGAVRNILYYSDPFNYYSFSPTNTIEFDSDITVLAIATSSLIIGCKDKTYVLRGKEPKEFIVSENYDFGAIPGSLVYAVQKEEIEIPYWANTLGYLVKHIEGKLVDIIPVGKERLRFSVPKSAAGLFRSKDGKPQFMFSMEQPSDVGFGDSISVEVIKSGRLMSVTYDSLNIDATRITDNITVT